MNKAVLYVPSNCAVFAQTWKSAYFLGLQICCRKQLYFVFINWMQTTNKFIRLFIDKD